MLNFLTGSLQKFGGVVLNVSGHNLSNLRYMDSRNDVTKLRSYEVKGCFENTTERTLNGERIPAAREIEEQMLR